MKKLYFWLLSATMLFTTSCNNEDLAGNAGQTLEVSYNISLSQIASRAYSDGSLATHLQYAVYDENDNLLENLTRTNGEIKGSTTVNLQLTTGNTYKIVFWAAAPGAPYSLNFSEKTMTVNYEGALSNDEARDAFYACDTFEVVKAESKTIELKRPFAQLNIGTADTDLEASVAAGYTPVFSSVKVPTFKTMNLLSGEVSDEETVEFGYAELAEGTFPVEGYTYLAMNYLLVGKEKHTVEVNFDLKDNATNTKSRTVGSVPVQRNYRTNIFGAILSTGIDMTVTIKPEFNEGDLKPENK
jgi:hypothetical protein